MIQAPQKKTGTYTFLCSGAGRISVSANEIGQFVKQNRPLGALTAATAGAF
jgi:hypothetical protein